MWFLKRYFDVFVISSSLLPQFLTISLIKLCDMFDESSPNAINKKPFFLLLMLDVLILYKDLVNDVKLQYK